MTTNATPTEQEKVCKVCAQEPRDEDVETTYGSPCPKCGCDHSHAAQCWNCGGEGYVDVYEDDPLWYDPGDEEPCDVCHCHGAMRWCGQCGHDYLRAGRGTAPTKEGESDERR